MILFINGFILGCEPLRPYWSSSRKDPDEFINAAKAFFNDNHVEAESFINGSGDWFGSKAWSRQSYGRKLGKEILPMINAFLEPGETIKIVSHSMGAATAEGIIETFTSGGLKIEKVVHFAPANANKIRIAEETKTIERLQINATGDLVIERFADPFSKEDALRIPGIKRYGKVKWDPWKLHTGHMNYLKDRNLPFDLDSHFDLKTYAFVFDWASDLELLNVGKVIGQRKKKDKYFPVFEILYGSKKTTFDRLYLNGKYLKYLEDYRDGFSTKFSA
jgi:hypothetical protein